VGGNLQAISKLGRGTSFYFQLPLTLSVIRTLLVEISGECYAFPLTRIEQAIRLHQSEINYVENRQYFILNGHNIGLIRADQVLDLSPSKFISESFSVVIISDQLNRYGLVVDQFLGEKNLVIRPLDNRLGKVQDISAAAILEDGSPVLILDVLDLVRSIDKVLTTTSLSQATYEPDGTWKTAAKRILVIDDSPTVREMERKILINQGYLVDGAVDGMEGWNALVSGKYDLVITDIDMPRLNGIKLVNHIKKHPQLKSTPVIIVSYKDREDDRLEGLEAGADYYLTKSSFHDDTLINAVADLLGI
jgi:two-component system sensor histidine kinase and response regulator WspE